MSSIKRRQWKRTRRYALELGDIEREWGVQLSYYYSGIGRESMLMSRGFDLTPEAIRLFTDCI